MYHVINLVVLESKHLSQPAANLVERGHRDERLAAIRTGNLSSSNRHRIEIVMPKFAGGRVPLRVVPEVRSVRVPLANSGRAGKYRLLWGNRRGVAKHRHAAALARGRIFERLLAKHRRSVRPRGECAHATGNTIEMELLDLLKDRVARPGMPALDHVERILSDPARLIGIAR